MKILKTIEQLQHEELIEPDQSDRLSELAEKYSVSITPDVLDTIKEKSQSDPVYRQYVPDLQEEDIKEDQLFDPIGDEAHEVTKGLIHRYSDRVLFRVTPTCAVYCRFCFRRETIGRGKETLSEQDIEAALQYIEKTTSIREVILSGGDPLVLSARRLKSLMNRLNAIEHLKLIRIHTRSPVGAPQLITEDLLKAFESPKQLYFVVHTNHAQELSNAALKAISKLKSVGIVFAQTVLLKGINNHPDKLLSLFSALSEIGVKPYYLHHPDKANGTGHFQLSLQEGMEIYKSLRGKISGHLIPDYVLDIPGGYGKVPINRDWIAPHPDGGYSVEDIHGNKHRYYD